VDNKNVKCVLARDRLHIAAWDIGVTTTTRARSPQFFYVPRRRLLCWSHKVTFWLPGSGWSTFRAEPPRIW